MHLRTVHAEADLRALRQLVHNNPLGLLTTGIRSETQAFLQSSHIPFVLDVADPDSETELGVLRGHLARGNPQSKAIVESLAAQPPPLTPATLEDEVLVIFTARAQHYVTPKFYTATKPDTGKVVPTWNYAAAQAYGKAMVYYDSHAAETSAFLDRQIHDLSQHGERSIMGYTGAGNKPGPWMVSDAPERYIDMMKKNIIGIEIAITRLEGKFKMSQELRPGDRRGVIQGFGDLGTDVGQEVSRIIEERTPQKTAKA